MDRFRKHLSKLRSEARPAFPVRVQFVKRAGEWKDHFGDCNIVTDKRGSRYFRIILVDDRSAGWLGEQLMIDGLVHEWAHALNWSHLQDSKASPDYHGGDWGVWYAKLYRMIYRSK